MDKTGTSRVDHSPRTIGWMKNAPAHHPPQPRRHRGSFLSSCQWSGCSGTKRTRPVPCSFFALVLNIFFGLLLTVFMSREGSLLPFKFDYVLAVVDGALGVSAASIARPLEGFWRVPLIVVYQLMVPMMICWFFVTRSGNPACIDRVWPT